jgi:hypothetical protein
MTIKDYSLLFKKGRSEYDNQMDRLKTEGRHIVNIQATVSEATKSIESGGKAFVIYGEPQSGKTEMMICLVGKLIDMKIQTIVVLVNDSIDLQNQNLERFQTSRLNPTPMGMSDALMSALDLTKATGIIFCKKNSKDLQKLLTRLTNIKNIVVIDDEADFATPNAKINKAAMTKINELVGKLRALPAKKDGLGVWIGVTATPARLDLNNTLENERSAWVHFAPHPDYCGHDVFFPPFDTTWIDWALIELPDHDDTPKYLRRALVRYVSNVAHLNLTKFRHEAINTVMIVHTSGKKDDHEKDRKIVDKFFIEISDPDNPNFQARYAEIEEYVRERYGAEMVDEVLDYVAKNSRSKIVRVINSDADKTTEKVKTLTEPVVPFTIAIGGNIISRGVTFNNLLTMYFTRTAKIIQQDTYIQRARMFGNRRQYLDHFELHIQRSLYLDWHQSFTYHRLALASIKSEAPIWLEGSRVRAVAPTSVDKANVYIDKGEISFGKFRFNSSIASATKDSAGGLAEFEKILKLLPNDYVTDHILKFVRSQAAAKPKLVAFHFSGAIEKFKDADYIEIKRDRGFFGKGDLEEKKFPEAVHHFKIYFNKSGNARLYYKYTEKFARIRFVKWRAKPE